MSEKTAELTKQAVRALVAKVPANRRAATICALVGHSRIITTCFGYVSCGRCEDQIGDTLASVFDTTKCVIVGHDCPKCRENGKALTWKDTLGIPKEKQR